MIYIASGVRGFLAPPELKIDQPEPDSRVTATTLHASGKTEPAVTLTINDELVTVDQEGNFDYEVAVIPGLNRLEFVATNRIGKETKQSRTVLADYQVSPSPVVTPSPSPSPSPTTQPTVSPTAKVSSSPSPTNSPKE